MSESFVISVLRDAISTGLMLSAPILAVAMIIGLLISILQATTQIQEQTLTFVPKLIAVAVIGLVTGNWMLHTMVGFMNRIFVHIANITK